MVRGRVRFRVRVRVKVRVSLQSLLPHAHLVSRAEASHAAHALAAEPRAVDPAVGALPDRVRVRFWFRFRFRVRVRVRVGLRVRVN